MSSQGRKIPVQSNEISAFKRTFQAQSLWASVILILVVSSIFWIFPTIDHTMTGLFYSKETWFPARTDEFWIWIRRFGIKFSIGISIWVLALAAIRILFWNFPAFLSGRKLAFLISTALLGPGFLVNIILKDFWGRPRPHMVMEYGGSLPYTKVWEITDHCADNCSFVSGEAASSFWLLAFAFLVPKEMRLGLISLVCVFTAALSINRIAFGGHFLSDVVISWSLMLFIILLMKGLILDRPPGTLDPYDSFLTQIGKTVSNWFQRR